MALEELLHVMLKLPKHLKAFGYAQGNRIAQSKDVLVRLVWPDGDAAAFGPSPRRCFLVCPACAAIAQGQGRSGLSTSAMPTASPARADVRESARGDDACRDRTKRHGMGRRLSAAGEPRGSGHRAPNGTWRVTPEPLRWSGADLRRFGGRPPYSSNLNLRVKVLDFVKSGGEGETRTPTPLST